MSDIPLGRYGPFRSRLLKLRSSEVDTHFHILGVTGSGKSRFIANLYVNLIAGGRAATLIDPHGDLARLVLAELVSRGYFRDGSGFQKLLYLDLPGGLRRGLYAPYNALQRPYPPHAVAQHVLEAMHRCWPALAGGLAPMFDTLVLNGVKALVSNNLPLPALYRFLTNKPYRDQLLEKESDADVVSIFRNWYDRLGTRDQMDQAGSTLRRVNLLTFSPVLKHSLGQRENLLDYRSILDEGRSVIVNLALPDADSRRLLGSLLTVSVEQAALSRADISPSARGPGHHLLIDEFSEFVSTSEEALGRMLSLTRKYGLFLVMAHQTYSQASSRFQSALQNVGVACAFRLGREDAEIAVRSLGRVAPRSLSVRDEEEVEGVGMREQWEQQVQELQDLRPRYAMLRKELPPWPWPFAHSLKRPTTRVYKVRTLNLLDPTVDAEEVAAVEEYYFRTYFRPAEASAEAVTAPKVGRNRRLV